MNLTLNFLSVLILGILLFTSCSDDKSSVKYDFDSIPDRYWAGEEFWTVPLEDWRVKDGRIECSSDLQDATFSVLSRVLADGNEPFTISMDMGLMSEGENPGSAGLIIGSRALEDNDVRSAIYFGSGISCGVNTEGYAFIGPQTKQLPENFQYGKFGLHLEGSFSENSYKLTLKVTDGSGNDAAEVTFAPEEPVSGIIQIVNNIVNSKSKNKGPRFWYDNLGLYGKKFEFQPEKSFGPVFWTMYTLSNDILKISAQLPPVSDSENHEAVLQVKENNEWVTIQTGVMDPAARNVLWKVKDWDSSVEKDFRVLFSYINSMGESAEAEYTGRISKEPVGRPLRFGALTCQFHYGFPYSPVSKNLELSKADILYFSGDQIYEGNGGYPIKREPEDVAILNYLGKWYMFGWSFGDVMRNVPTICTPDDHDVFQGNIWGEGGLKMREGTGDFISGYRQTPKMINAVHRTNCSHLPDPYDPTPMEQGISVWYTGLKYGGVSFAIVTDRIFKSGPENVSNWEGRQDHVREPLANPTSIERPELEFLGKRQEAFLEDWIHDWKGVKMKVLLSQTLFANVATHHGSWDYYLYGDMDSGGWPRMQRDQALKIIRKAFVFHIAGDQHVPSIVQYGIDDYRDAGWCYVNPAIAVGYSRWFRPDELGQPVRNRPEHGLPNTGEYQDAFGNLNYVYAIGNPVNFTPVRNRYELAHIKSSGYGIVIFDNDKRTITMESWRFLANVAQPGEEDQHPGWPFTVNQIDNYGRKPVAWLPEIKIQGESDPVVELVSNKTGETIYIMRIKGNEFKPWVFEQGSYKIRIGYPETDKWKQIDNLQTGAPGKEVIISF